MPIDIKQTRDELDARAVTLETALGAATTKRDREAMERLGREYKTVEEARAAFERIERITKELAQTDEVRATETDPELQSLANHEYATLEAQRKEAEDVLHNILTPPDPMDTKDVLMEIRAGTGGDEAAIFAADLFRMYQRFAERKGWKTHLLTADRTTRGGYKDITMEIAGQGAYRTLRHESGVHRVQRVPETEKAGRVHTSTATVVILPKIDETEITIDPNDLVIEATTSSGHGGQSVNTTYSAILIRHIPSGITASCQDERSQRQNREKAMEIIRARVFAYEMDKREQEGREARRVQIGSAKRSEKIRTYNFPQDRLTDHRINENFHAINSIMDGDLERVVHALSESPEHV